VLLNTCKRQEFYSASEAKSPKIVRHLFRVVSGLESPFVGDQHIQAQVKNAYLLAAEKYELDSSLHSLFQKALNVGKRVRTETEISQGAVSYAAAVVKQITDFNQVITVIGINNITEEIIKYLLRKGTKTVLLGNRTLAKAQKFACEAFSLDCLKEKLAQTDILITATSAPHLIVKKEAVALDKKMQIFDLAMPPDVDPELGQYPDIQLFSIREIEALVDQNLEKRQAAIQKAEAIIEEELRMFLC